MKKWIILGLVVLALVGIFCINRIASGRLILASQVQRVEFRGYDSCDAPAAKRVELTDSEVRNLVMHLNCASYAGRVTGQGCPSDFGFTFYFKDGTRISARDAYFSKIEVHPREGEMYWVKSQALVDYAQELVEKYDLQTKE